MEHLIHKIQYTICNIQFSNIQYVAHNIQLQILWFHLTSELEYHISIIYLNLILVMISAYMLLRTVGA